LNGTDGLFITADCDGAAVVDLSLSELLVSSKESFG
jgi:hypothetical protein